MCLKSLEHSLEHSRHTIKFCRTIGRIHGWMTWLPCLCLAPFSLIKLLEWPGNAGHVISLICSKSIAFHVTHGKSRTCPVTRKAVCDLLSSVTFLTDCSLPVAHRAPSPLSKHRALPQGLGAGPARHWLPPSQHGPHALSPGHLAKVSGPHLPFSLSLSFLFSLCYHPTYHLGPSFTSLVVCLPSGRSVSWGKRSPPACYCVFPAPAVGLAGSSEAHVWEMQEWL